MITKVDCFKNSVYQGFHSSSKQKQNKQEGKYSTEPMRKDFAEAYKNYAISFCAKKQDAELSAAEQNMKTVINNMNMDGQELMAEAVQVAQKFKSPVIDQMHFIYAGLSKCLDDIYAIDEGEISAESYNEDSDGTYAVLMTRYNNERLIEDENLRKRLAGGIEEVLSFIEDEYFKKIESNNGENKNAVIAGDFIKDVVGTYKNALSVSQGSQLDSMNLIFSAFNINGNKKLKPFIQDIDTIISSYLYLDDFDNNEGSIYIPTYDERAKNIFKNIDLGTNMVVIKDKSTDDGTILKSLNKVFNSPSQSSARFNPKNTEVTVINENAPLRFIVEIVNESRADKDKNHIIILKDIQKSTFNSFPEDYRNENGIKPDMVFYPDAVATKKILDVPSNIKFISICNKDYYYGVQAEVGTKKDSFFYNFCEVNMPVISNAQAKELFKTNNELTKDLNKTFSQSAIQKCVEASSRMPGNYPEKTIQLMERISAYYVDKNKEISSKDVEKYLKEASGLIKNNDNNDSVKLIFDTGKRLKDIVGKESTKKEAAAIVKQIKSNKIGTKGYIVYSQDGSAGSGRRHTVQAIAGEAKVPYAEINTMDFATKEVSIFEGAAQSPEASMKKLFALVKTQAEENPNKSAILFIENFEYFAIGEIVSEYHQKAMAQLLREMDIAEKQGLNIVVMGSVSNPKYIGEATAKSFKFIDRLEISSPAINKDSRYEIIKQSIKQENIRLASKQEDEKDSLIRYTADITGGFPFISIKSLIKKAQTVALERGHKQIDKSDITEAYLQITTGRPSVSNIPEYEKELTTSHECGHATNLEVMNNVAKKLGKPWHVPGKVNFITLDPRGIYGGAVYHGENGNNELSFENVFANIVCAYGGHSAEKEFYDMDGSYGITQDLETATSIAQAMVMDMGQGHDTGKITIDEDMDISPELRRDIERDVRRILENALTVSDLITEYYADFNRQFTEKYSHLVGTGECLVDGDTFRKELQDWRNSQPKSKQEELDLLDRMIIDIMRDTKQGKIY